MKELLRCRAMEAMCRQRATFDLANKWKWLAEAEMWQHRVMDQIDLHFEECNPKPSAIAASKVSGIENRVGF